LDIISQLDNIQSFNPGYATEGVPVQNFAPYYPIPVFYWSCGGSSYSGFNRGPTEWSNGWIASPYRSYVIMEGIRHEDILDVIPPYGDIYVCEGCSIQSYLLSNITHTVLAHYLVSFVKFVWGEDDSVAGNLFGPRMAEIPYKVSKGLSLETAFHYVTSPTHEYLVDDAGVGATNTTASTGDEIIITPSSLTPDYFTGIAQIKFYAFSNWEAGVLNSAQWRTRGLLLNTTQPSANITYVISSGIVTSQLYSVLYMDFWARNGSDTGNTYPWVNTTDFQLLLTLRTASGLASVSLQWTEGWDPNTRYTHIQNAPHTLTFALSSFFPSSSKLSPSDHIVSIEMVAQLLNPAGAYYTSGIGLGWDNVKFANPVAANYQSSTASGASRLSSVLLDILP